MRLLFYLSWALIALCSSANAQTAFEVTQDTGAFIKNAHSIKKFEKNQFVVTNVDKAVYTTKQVITVLDQKGDDQLFFYEYTDKYKKLEDVSIIIYNSIGLPVKTYTKKDLKQDATGDGLIDEGRYFYIHLRADKYPFTVEFNSTVSYKGIVNYPSFTIQAPAEAVRFTEHSVVLPKDIGLRYLNQATEIQPEITETGDKITYTWKAENLPALPQEAGMLSWYNCYPRVWIAPNKFRLDNYPGDFSSWAAFGSWYGGLGASSRDLNEYNKAIIRKLVGDASDPKEKARIIYEHLQNNFRYVSIQLGIGGFRPFPASFTAANKYGDCKALSNYMQACLDAVGIKSCQALVNAGANAAAANTDFPIDVFNHVILCIPFEKDSVWLECTSKENDFGVLGSFTENRNALLITEEGGVLVPTPASTARQNTLGIKAVVRLQEDGSGEVHTELSSTGEYKLSLIYRLYNESTDDQKAALMRLLEMPTPEHFAVKLPADKRTETLVTVLDAGFEKIPAFTAGTKMFLNAQWHPLNASSLPEGTERRFDYYFPNPYQKHDTTIYIIPSGYTVGSLPKPVERPFKYGLYRTSYEADKTANTVTAIATLVLDNHHIPAADFNEARQFISEVVKDKTQKIVIVKE